MNFSYIICPIVLGLFLAKWAMEFGLNRLNQRHVLSHADAIPEAFKGAVDHASYAKSVQYTLAKTRFSQFEDSWHVLVLLGVLCSGVLPWAFHSIAAWLGESVWAMAAFLFVVGFTLMVMDLPLDWRAQFRLEERFGFNTTTQQLWWLDRLKQLLLGLGLGYPLLVE